jgi:hypothetical protein
MADLPPIPPAIPDYRLLRLIGRGSYGDVWLATGITGPHRAIKVVSRSRFQDDRPYLGELRGLRHFAAISLVEAGQLALLHVGHNDEAGFFYYVMEAADDAAGEPIRPETYVPNTLAEALRRRGHIPAAQTLAIAASLAEALAGLHARGLVHRDIKPSNIIFVAGSAKLADIGTVGSVTAEQSVPGTPGYMPLEGPGTTAADVYSLGKVIYEILMGLDRGRFPLLPPDFESRPDRKLMLELNEIIAKACDPSPSRRHPDGSSLLDEIRCLQSGRSVRQKRQQARALLARRLGLGAAAAAGCAALVPFLLREHFRRPREIYQNALSRAALALELGEPNRAQVELLNVRAAPGAADPRGFEWYALWSDALRGARQPPPQVEPASQRAGVLSISRDGRRLAVTGPGTTINLVATDSLQPIAALDAGARPAGFLADDSVLAWTEAGTLHTWNAKEGLTEIAPLGMGRSVRLVTLAADGSLLAAAGARGELEIREAPDARLRHAIDAHPGRRITGLAVSRHGEFVATVDEESRVKIWRTNTGILEADDDAPAAIRALSFGPSAAHLALAFESGGLELRRTPDLQMVARVEAGGTAFRALAFDFEGRRLLAGEATGALTVFDANDWTEVARIPAGTVRSAVQALAFSGDGQVLAAQLADGSLRVWPLRNPTP